MNIDFLLPVLNRCRALQEFASYFMSFYDENEFYPEVRACMFGECPDIAKIAENLYEELILSVFSEMDFLDFLGSLDNEYKIGLLTSNGIIAINDKDDNEILSLLKDLGEEKVLETLCTDDFMNDYVFC